ncbi:MAG TPA: ThuA domain-containing protein [Bryobacteraceae bacterium]|nr:ThuA domain-containing protein [Bryobacterales bacterium]HRJ19449.1 ThuA domain-containing protein [Bryobacteraceae bacterium]
MKFNCFACLFLFLTGCLGPAAAQQTQSPKKRLLAIGAVEGFQHDATSHGLAMLWKLGVESGLWDTYIRTDTQLITKKKLDANAKNLDYFDAVAFYTSGELKLDEEQRAALMSFVKQDGKGFIAIHSASDTLYKWPEYGEMVGGYFDLHPWNTFQAPVIVEDRSHPASAHLPANFTIYDEIYQFKEFSRDRVRVLMRLDESKLDMTNKNIRRKDGDFAVTWVREFGKGRVFFSSFGHTIESWDRPDIQKMWLEAVKWSMRMTNGDATPRPRPAP